MQTLKKISSLLNPLEKRRAFLLFLMILVMALLDMIGVASILPFMTVLVNPEIIETNMFLNKLYDFSRLFGVKNNQHFFY